MSKSNLPNGGYTLTHGSNYMLDGFQFDTEYNGGVKEKARLPEAKGLAALPQGMIPPDGASASDIPDGVEADLHLDLSDMTRSAAQDIPVVDHSWLAQEPEPNLSGMRSLEDVLDQFSRGETGNPEANKLKVLQEAWGEESTNGLKIIPNNQREHAPYVNPYHEHQSQLPADEYRKEREKVLRELSYGGSLTKPLDLYKNASSEYGLLGKVYIKEAHFPHLFSGKWDEVIRKRCASAMYIIPKKKGCAFDRFLGMEVVDSPKNIPWGRVAAQVLPKLEACGVIIPSEGSAKERVRKAYISLIEGDNSTPAPAESWFPIQMDASEGITLGDAKRSLEASEVVEETIISQEEIQRDKKARRLERIAQELIRGGFLSEEQVEDVAQDNSKNIQSRIARLYDLAARPVENQSYQGEQTAHIMNKRENLPTGKVDSKKVAAGKKIAEDLDRYVRQGIIQVDDLEAIKGLSKRARWEALYNLTLKGAQAKVSSYKGQVFEAHTQKTASLPDKSAHEVQGDKIGTWLRQKMTEGSLGDELDGLLSLRYDAPVREAHSERIASLREAHEGVSGHAYVDAESYLTQGMEGCDKGALIHRANQIPTLMKTARCGSCVFNQGGVCQKYNKPIVASAQEVIPNLEEYRAENIRLANGTDADRTAALFVNNYDPTEFGLAQEANISLKDTPSNEQLGEVLFGGFEV